MPSSGVKSERAIAPTIAGIADGLIPGSEKQSLGLPCDDLEAKWQGGGHGAVGVSE